MPFLKDSKISVSGPGASRDFSFYYRSHPIPVTKVTVHGYGLLSGLAESRIPPLSIHAGDTYSRSHAQEFENTLKNTFAEQGWQVKVFTDVDVSEVGATLDYSVLAYPDDVLYIDEQAFDTALRENE